ncbi:MAG TPA: translation initiation factor IF-3, partial [Candidatus Portnoybacteria bacterium]|nr:translation initiation factor IF-3 [Candidatus Portnoybacteria bacterium]
MFRKPFGQKQNRINHWIKAPEVRVVDERGEQLGVL